jgi:hypothetical protein
MQASLEIPHQIQSSLLTVGMRIRKSVPEGYKTVAKAPLSAYTSYNSTTSDASIPTYRSFAELAPYCGILKTGNLSVQSMPNPTILTQPQGFYMSGDDQPDYLPSSQEPSISSISTQRMPTPNKNKRSLDTYPDEDEDEEEIFSQPGLVQTNIRIYPISHTHMPNLNTLSSPTRSIAVPRSRRKKFVWQGMEGQENMPAAPSGTMGGAFDFDFEEATFLRQREEVDRDVEMDVS